MNGCTFEKPDVYDLHFSHSSDPPPPICIHCGGYPNGQHNISEYPAIHSHLVTAIPNQRRTPLGPALLTHAGRFQEQRIMVPLIQRALEITGLDNETLDYTPYS